MNTNLWKSAALAGLAASVGFLVLSACGVNQPMLGEDMEVRVIEGIQCVVYSNADNSGGLSCNWDAYNEQVETAARLNR